MVLIQAQVNVRPIALSRNATPNAIHQRVFKIRHRYGINIQGGSKRMRESPKGNRKRRVETLLDSDLPKAEILRRVAAAPLAPKVSLNRQYQSIQREAQEKDVAAKVRPWYAGKRTSETLPCGLSSQS